MGNLGRTHTYIRSHVRSHTHTPVQEEGDHGPEERVHDEIQKVPVKEGERAVEDTY